MPGAALPVQLESEDALPPGVKQMTLHGYRHSPSSLMDLHKEEFSEQ